MKKRVVMSIFASTLLATVPAWGQTNVIKRNTSVKACKWGDTSPFSEGLAWVMDRSNKIFLINKQGKIVK